MVVQLHEITTRRVLQPNEHSIKTEKMKRLVARMLEHQCALVVLSGVLLISPSAWTKEVPPEWVICKKSTDCDVVSSSCGPSMGINIHHKTAAKVEICKTENCSGSCDGSAIQAFAAICKTGQCVPDYNAKQPRVPDVHFELKDLEPRCPEDSPNCGIEHQ